MGCGQSTPPVQEMTFEEDALVPAQRSTKRMFKIVCIGASGVGKTSLMHRWVKGRFSTDFKTTIGADFMAKSVELQDKSEALLQVWDTAGQEKFASLGRAFFRGSDLCVLVCSLDNIASLESLVVWRKEFLEQAEPDDALGFPFILIANKADLADRRITHEQLERWARANNVVASFECSAMTGSSVDDAFLYAAKLCARRADEKA